ncbi:MAG: hypothetical protein JWP94_3569 [Mucilaginibacter sp.]|nr:hypothetical protein [Mucilaginibacter sp.]
MTLNRFLRTYDTLVASAVGFYLIYLYTTYSGIGISPDSIMYTSAARNLHAHGSLITFNNTYITDFPVFYPFFLWVVLLFTGIDPIAAGPVLNGLMFATLIFLSGWIIQRFRSGPWLYKWLMLPAIVLSPALLNIYTYLWSETLFILIFLFFIIACRQYLVQHTLPTLLVFAGVAALSSITRYAGITLIGTGGLLMLLDRYLPLKKKIVHILIYGVAASSILALNLLRNAMTTSKLTGPREASVTPFVENLHYFGTVMCDWTGFSEKLYPFATAIAIILFIGLTAVVVFNYFHRSIRTYENLVSTFALIYGLFIVVSSTLSRYERINTRLLAPIFIPLLLSCTYWAIGVIRNVSHRWKWILTIVFGLLMLGFSYQELSADMQRYDDENDYGVPGYSDDSWNKSPFAAYLKKNKKVFKPGIPIYSDANEALYFLSGTYAKLLPHRYFKADIQKFYTIKHYYLVWFPSMDNPELISLKDIIKVKKLTLLKQFADGAIYEYNGER